VVTQLISLLAANCAFGFWFGINADPPSKGFAVRCRCSPSESVVTFVQVNKSAQRWPESARTKHDDLGIIRFGSIETSLPSQLPAEQRKQACEPKD